MRVTVRTRVVGVVMMLLVMAWVTPALGITLRHPGPGQGFVTPEETSSLVQRQDPALYQHTDCTTCHTAQAPSVNNNHGMYLRPVTSVETSVWSDNPYFGQLPTSATFSLTPGAANRADWIIGGLAVGAERYIFDSTFATGTLDFQFPRIGNLQWLMDFGRRTRRADTILNTNRQAIETTAWRPYTNNVVNYFTGTANPTETANDFGCVRCHSYGARAIIDTETGVPSYTIEEWGVTCGNCHTATIGSAHALGPIYTSDACNSCHMRRPAPASRETSGRPQQLEMFIWDTGHARNHRNQGYEMTKPEVAATTDTPGAVETTGGAGHPNSWNDIRGFAQRSCMRCHTTQGYLAHTTNGTDVPYSWTATTGFSNQKTYLVETATVVGVSCVACHTTHDTELGHYQIGNRSISKSREDTQSGIRSNFEQCADCHREPQLIPEDATLNFNATRVSHPQREMFLGYGGYGVSVDDQPHEMAEVWCQYCHMPATVATPEGDRSHLFRIIMPEQTLSTVTVGFLRYPAGATTTTAIPQTPAPLSDDSCTGSDCHEPTDAVKSFLQRTIEFRQGRIIELLRIANQRMGASRLSNSSPQWLMARTNIRIVERDGSLGMHNYYYAKGLLDQAISTFDGIVSGVTSTTITISASTLVPNYAGAVTITGQLRDATGTPVTGRALTLQRSSDGASWIDVGVVGSVTGTYRFTVRPTTRTLYRWVFAGDDAALMSASGSVTVKPRASLTTPTAHSVWRVRTRHTVSGFLRPRHTARAVNVRLQFYRRESGRWVLRRTVNATNSNFSTYTRYSATTSMTLRGTWRVRAVYAETATNSAVNSGFKNFTVR